MRQPALNVLTSRTGTVTRSHKVNIDRTTGTKGTGSFSVGEEVYRLCNIICSHDKWFKGQAVCIPMNRLFKNQSKVESFRKLGGDVIQSKK